MTKYQTMSYAQPNTLMRYQTNQQFIPGYQQIISEQNTNGNYLNMPRSTYQQPATNQQIIYGNQEIRGTQLIGQQQLLGSGQVNRSTYQQVVDPNINYSQQSFTGSRRTQKVKYVPVTNYVPVYQTQQIPINTIPLNQIQHVSQRVILNEPQAFQERVNYHEDIKTQDYVQQTIINKKIVKVPKDSLVQTTNGAWNSQFQQRSSIIPPPVPVAREDKSCCSPWILGLLGLLALGGILAAILAGKNNSSQNLTMTPTTRVNGTVGTPQSVEPTISNPIISNPIISNETVINGTTAVTSVKPIYQIQPTEITNVVNKVGSSNLASVAAPQYINSTTVNSIPANTVSLVPQNQLIKPQNISSQPTQAQIIRPQFTQPQPIYPQPVQAVQPTQFQPQIIQPQIIEPAQQFSSVQPLQNVQTPVYQSQPIQQTQTLIPQQTSPNLSQTLQPIQVNPIVNQSNQN